MPGTVFKSASGLFELIPFCTAGDVQTHQSVRSELCRVQQAAGRFAQESNAGWKGQHSPAHEGNFSRNSHALL